MPLVQAPGAGLARRWPTVDVFAGGSVLVSESNVKRGIRRRFHAIEMARVRGVEHLYAVAHTRPPQADHHPHRKHPPGVAHQLHPRPPRNQPTGPTRPPTRHLATDPRRPHPHPPHPRQTGTRPDSDIWPSSTTVLAEEHPLT